MTWNAETLGQGNFGTREAWGYIDVYDQWPIIGTIRSDTYWEVSWPWHATP